MRVLEKSAGLTKKRARREFAGGQLFVQDIRDFG